MSDRKLDTRGLDCPDTAHRRNLFDQHMDRCANCQSQVCLVAQSLWRAVCLAALRNHVTPKGGA